MGRLQTGAGATCSNGAGGPLGAGRAASGGPCVLSTWHALGVRQPFNVLASSSLVIIPRGNVSISKMRKLILREVEKMETARKWLEMP